MTRRISLLEGEKNNYLKFVLLSVKIILLFIFFLYLLTFFVQLSKVPLMGDDFSNMAGGMANKINLQDPMITRGILWVLILSLFFDVLKSSSIAHIVIGIVHILNAFLMIFLLTKLTRIKEFKKSVFFIISCFVVFFIINPIDIDNILWITGAYPIFLLAFSLLATVCLLKHYEAENDRWLYLFVLLSSLAYFCNEQGLLIFPFYIAIWLLYNYGHISLKNIKDNVINLNFPLIFLLWISPYVAYRLFLYITYHSTSATQPYEKTYEVGIIIHTYSRMIQIIVESIPYPIYIIEGIVLFILLISRLLLVNYYDKNSEAIKKYSFFIWFSLFILFLLLPFSLLNGWLEYRFFYISSSIFIFMNAMFLIFMFIDLIMLYENKLIKAKKFVFTFVISVLMVLCISSLKNYSLDTLKPIDNLSLYIHNFITLQKEKYNSLPEKSVVFLDIRNPEQKMPGKFYVLNSIRVNWVPPSLVKIGAVPNNVKVVLLNGINLKNNYISTPYFFIDKKELENVLRDNKNFYCYTYNGNKLEQINGSQIIFEKEDGSERMAISLTQ